MSGTTFWPGTLDWISPAIEMVGEAAALTSAIIVPAGCDHTGYEVAFYLIDHGVMVYGIYVVNETFMLSVAEHQVEYARRLLAAAGMLGE